MTSAVHDHPSTSATRLYVPGWWVRAWEDSLARQTLHEASINPGISSSVLPTVDLAQLNLWAVLLCDLQHQMFTETWNVGDPMNLVWGETRKLIAADDLNSLSRLAIAMEQLGGIRIVASHSSGVMAAPLFRGERWEGVGTPDRITLSLFNNPHTLELLAGYADGHADVLRSLHGQLCIRDILEDQPPLVLWKPVWLELGAAEQAVYLRIEKAMQWDMNWLQLDGVFGTAIDRLFQNIRLPKRSQASHSAMMERLRICGKLGRKLVSHGVMAREPSSDFFALAAPETLTNGPSLVWQASSDRLRSVEEQAHFGSAAQAILKQVVGPIMPEWISLFSAGTTKAYELAHMNTQWERLKALPGGALRVGPATLIQTHTLFLEWALRRLPGAKFPLKAEFQNSETINSCRLDGDVGANFNRFVERVLSSPDVAKLLSEVPDLSFGISKRTEADPLFAAMRSFVTSQKAQNKPEVQLRSDPLKMASSDERPSRGPATSSLDPTGGARPANVVTTNAGQSALLRIAREELDKMMRADVRSFSALKDVYMKSLDDSQRQLMMDVQRRMQPQQFDLQLKQRLVRFMVEHPSEWKSTSAILQ